GGEVEAAPGQSQSATWQGDRPEPWLPAASGVLWVDDHPENNAIQIDRLGRNGVMVDTALSTEEAAEKLRERRYQSIISDMGRFEHGRSVSDAGVQLVEQVRRYDQDTPVLIYASSRAVQTYGPRAKAAGANLVTSSPLELAEKLRRAGLP
ncbi:MAG: response regulator, partial [Sciscionella sp.]